MQRIANLYSTAAQALIWAAAATPISYIDIVETMAFVKEWFEFTETPVYFCSLPNEKNDPNEPNEQHVWTRDLGAVEDFIGEWNRPGRGLFFCVSTINGKKRNKENVAEIPGLWADIDFKDVKETPDSILKRVKALPLPPSIIVQSGNGLHLYWRFKEPVTINIVDGAETIERIEAALKLLADLVGGDMKVTQVAALMRLPGTHNTKRDEWKPVEIESSNTGEFELDDIEEMISITSPIVLRKLTPSPTQGEINPFLAAAKTLGFKPSIDAEKRLSEMIYMGGGDAAIHETQISVSASLLNAGNAYEEVVRLVLEATRGAAGDYGSRWNWKREEKEIRKACDTWLKKHPPAKAEKLTPKLVTGATATVHKLDDARKEKENAAPKPKSQKVIDRENMHILIGEAVLKVLSDKGEPVMVVGDQLWRYVDGLWIELDNHGRHHLDRLIETCIRGLGSVSSSLKLVAEVRGWIFRNPDIGRDDMEWDDHGKIAIKGGLIDIKTLAYEPAKPSHHVTARINCDYDPKAQCPVWLEMLDSTFGDKIEQERVGTIQLIQEVLGCALIEEKSKALSRALILQGASNTGKTDLIKTISGLLTDRPISTPIGALDGAHGLMEFRRKAPWILHEAFKGGVWHFSDIVKSILSGDPVQINVKNGALTTQRIRQPVIWGTNYPPQFKEATRAIINRMVVIVTSVVFDPKEPVGVALLARANDYSEPSDLILATEKPGLLNWALAGLRRALARGRIETTSDMDATLEGIRTDGNVVAAFLDECVDYGSDYMVSTSDFCAALAVHFSENKEGATAPSNDSIGRAMVATGDRRIGIDRKALRDNKHHYYAGIHLNDIGSDYWQAAAGDGLARGKTARLSNTVAQVNRLIPASWSNLPVMQRLKSHYKSLRTPEIFPPDTEPT
jgi:hypothetical protein